MSIHPQWVFFYAKFMERYSIIHEKNSREIVLLRGSGCDRLLRHGDGKHLAAVPAHLHLCQGGLFGQSGVL